MHGKARGRIKWLCLPMAAVMISMLLAPMLAQVEWPTRINRFERYDPVYTAFVEPGTAQEDLRLPEHLRAVISIEELEVDLATFTQAQPEADMSDGYSHYDYYWYGYVAPKDAQDLYDAGELAIYTIHYAAQDGSGEVGEIGYRVYGSIDGSQNVWFACDETGIIESVVLDIPVTWSAYDYAPDTPGEYTFIADIGSYSYAQARPTAVITVEEVPENGDGHGHGELPEAPETPESPEVPEVPEASEVPVCTCPEGTAGHTDENCPYWVPPADCDCGISSLSNPWEHNMGCVHFSPIECMCREMIETTQIIANEDGSTQEEKMMVPGDYSGIHDPLNKVCPLYGSDTINVAKEDGKEATIKAEDSQFFTSRGMHTVGVVEKAFVQGTEGMGIMPLNVYLGYPHSLDMENYQKANSPTSGNASYSSTYTDGTTIPGDWVDYVNTIWLNKAINQYQWTLWENTGTNWAWGGNTAQETTGTPALNAFCRPQADVNGIWTVYSGEQLAYALTAYTSGQTIQLGANINLYGYRYDWSLFASARGLASLTFDGRNHSIYNIGVFAPTSGSPCFLGSYNNLTFKNVNIITSCITSGINHTGFLRTTLTTNGNTTTLSNVHIINSMVYSSYPSGIASPFGFFSNGTGTVDAIANVTNCSAENGYVYGRDHVSGFGFGGGNQVVKTRRGTIQNSMSVSNLICGTGGHSAGFMSCGADTINFSSCFAANEIYGSAMVGGFAGGLPNSNFNNCYSTGKLEGYRRLGGFVFYNLLSMNNCYSTTLVGLRSNPSVQGGFSTIHTTPTTSNCYAAGEVGNFDLAINNPIDVGGFISSPSSGTFTNCYYDKQTTAMREWKAGNVKEGSAQDTGQLLNIKGVLTTSTDKAGTGLTSAPGQSGFTGFSDNAQWDFTAVGHYPELAVFKTATNDYWGTTARANLVRAYSLASTATVMLNTWDNGYDWDADGVRALTQQSYNRALPVSGQSDHKGNKYTYDTVREIVSPFTVTASAAFGRLIAGGAPSNHGSTKVYDTIVINNSTDKGDIVHPGMDWYGISETVVGQTGTRPIRLNGYMNVSAGADATVYAGALYNHRSDVQLTMLDSVTDNLVVGLDNTKIWSASKSQGYPGSDAYYKVVTQPTQTTASQDAWLYTEIWRVQKGAGYTLQPGEVVDGDGYVRDSGGNYVYAESVKVTGAGTMGPDGTGVYTLAQQKWNGEFAMYPDTSLGTKYEVAYYWMLADGRYRTDFKIVDILPGKYKIEMEVIEEGTGTQLAGPKGTGAEVAFGTGNPMGTALHLGAGLDSGANTNYTLTPTAAATYATANNFIPYTDNTAAAWKLKTGATADLTKLTVTFRDAAGNIAGTGAVNNPTAGSQISMPITYHTIITQYDSIQKRDRESLKLITVPVIYTVEEVQAAGVGTGEYYLRFNKLANPPANEDLSVTMHGTAAGIASDGFDEHGTQCAVFGPEGPYINDTMFNTQITLEVRNKLAAVRIKKAIDNIGDFSAADQAALADYMFFIKLRNGAAADIALKHDDISNPLYVPITGSSVAIDVSETVRMEFDENYTVTIVNETGSTAAVSGKTVTIHPGDNVMIVVHNTFVHAPYFKDRDFVRNQFRPLA